MYSGYHTVKIENMEIWSCKSSSKNSEIWQKNEKKNNCAGYLKKIVGGDEQASFEVISLPI